MNTGQKVVKMEICKASKVNSQTVKKAALFGDKSMHSGLALILDELGKELSHKHGGIFPHAVLSSQHITMLCSQQPTSIEQVEKVLGKRKAEQYGKEILTCIQQFISQNPQSTSRQWISPKASRQKPPSEDNVSVSKDGQRKQKQYEDGKECNRSKKSKSKRALICVDSSEDEPNNDAMASTNDDDFDFTPMKRSKQT